MDVDLPEVLAEVTEQFARYEEALVANDVAVASTLFYRDTAPGRVGRQMQTWVRFAEGWKIVAAHVSIIDEARDQKR